VLFAISVQQNLLLTMYFYNLAVASNVNKSHEGVILFSFKSVYMCIHIFTSALVSKWDLSAQYKM